MTRQHLTLTVGVALTALLALPTAGWPSDAMDARRAQMLKLQADKPYPPDGLWRYEDQALAAYYLGQTAKGDKAILDEAAVFAKDPKLADFHWHAFMLERIYFLFNSKSRFFPMRMSPAAEKALVEMLWTWAGPNLSLEMTLPERDWWVWGSENHHLQAWSSAWGAAHVFAERAEFKDRTFPDGTSMADMAKAFDEYFKRWALNRASRGLFVECNSGYNRYSIGPLSNLADFSQDPELKRRITLLLDLFWADWAIEQIDGLRGGSRHRCYPGRDSLEECHMTGEAWYLFGIGRPCSTHPSVMCLATSFYRPPPLVTDLVLHTPARGVYPYISRRPGRGQGDVGAGKRSYVSNPNSLFGAAGLVYWLDPRCGDLVRYTWCTPDFIMGTSMVPALNAKAWANISSQNRWYGVIFGGHPTARIFFQPLVPPGGKASVYNDSWSVQSKGAMIVQRLRTASENTEGQRVWFDGALQRVETNGWIFAKGPRAYAAVRVVQGQAVWEDDDQEYRATAKAKGKGQWLALKDAFAPVVMEMACQSDYASFAAFQKAVQANPLAWDGHKVQYTSSGYHTSLTFWTDWSQPPQVGGIPVDYAPQKVYDSPFIQGDFGSGVVTLSNGTRKLTLDFNAR